ncbi:hypothetical protein OJF2_30730 [Aquisphaera giovannonii]|uniref:LTXXQ motif protein n=1 Tax=Aquisphaera giovannonii TaxID=406548 RepID=A0A5B9W1V7_9BACT|nr:hypothetical protein [Aquisphaera giovannonii]QEH34533.1 hypothetical protein OJF2_30730 [Aquisphaera giovannonii]
MMLPFHRPLATIASAAIMTSLLAGSYPLGAQEGSSKSQTKKADAKAEPKTEKAQGRVAPPDPTHRVPPGYSKLSLSDEQKNAIYKIQAKYYPQIQKLEKQADELREKRDAECEAVLKPAQKKHLQELEQQRKDAAAAKKAAAARESADKAKS